MAKKQCAHEPCTCHARESSRYCSTECENAAARSATSCACGHAGCQASERTAPHQAGGQR
jgi:hypothetical protein